MTAVEWLNKELYRLDTKVRSYNTIDYIKKRQSIVKQANEMFEQQIIETWHNGYNNQLLFYKLKKNRIWKKKF